MTKYRTSAANTWYEPYDWLINPIPQPVKKSASDVKEKIMKLFERKIDSNTAKNFKPKKICVFLMAIITNTKVEVIKN